MQCNVSTAASSAAHLCLGSPWTTPSKVQTFAIITMLDKLYGRQSILKFLQTANWKYCPLAASSAHYQGSVVGNCFAKYSWGGRTISCIATIYDCKCISLKVPRLVNGCWRPKQERLQEPKQGRTRPKQSTVFPLYSTSFWANLWGFT